MVLLTALIAVICIFTAGWYTGKQTSSVLTIINYWILGIIFLIITIGLAYRGIKSECPTRNVHEIFRT